MFVPAAFVFVAGQRRRLGDERVLVPVAWLAVTLGMVMLVRSQRWRYLLPAVAPLVLLVALAWEAELRGAARPLVGRRLRLPLVGILALLAAAGALVLAGVDGRPLLEAGAALRRPPWVLVPLLALGGGIAGLVLAGRRPRAALGCAVALAGIVLGSLNALTLEQRHRASDPRPFAREVRRIIGDAPIHYCCADALASHFHVYLDAPTTLLDQAGAARLLREGSWRYLLIAARALPALEREGPPGGGGRTLTEGRFGPYHFVLLGRD